MKILFMGRQNGAVLIYQPALLFGPSALSIFTVIFLALTLVYQQTGDADFTIQIGLMWCYGEALILVGNTLLGETTSDKNSPVQIIGKCWLVN